MADTELERMIVTIAGESTQYLQSLDASMKATTEAAQHIEREVGKIGVAHIAGGVLIAGVVEKIAGKFKELGQSALNGYAEAEMGEVKLTAMLESNGRAVESTLNSYKEYANQLQATTTMEDDYVLTLFKTAEQFDVTGGAAKKAVHDAVALAAANDSNASSMIRITAAMAKGDTATAMRFARMIPQLRGVKDETEFLAKYTKLAASGFKQAEAEAGTFTGMMTRLKVAFGNTLELFGKGVAEAIKPFVEWFRKASEWVQTLNPEIITMATKIGLVTVAVAALIAAWGPIVSVIGTVAGLIGAFFSPIGVAIAVVVAGVATLIESLGGMEAAWAMAKNAAMAFWDEVKPILILVKDVAVAAFNTIWTGVKAVFAGIASTVKSVWFTIAGSTQTTWAEIKTYIIDALIKTEFIFANFGRVMKLLWVETKLAVVVFADYLEYQFTTVMPAWIGWFVDNSIAQLKNMWTNAKTLFSNLGENAGNTFKYAMAVVKGETADPYIWKPLTEGFKKALITLPKIAEQQMSPLKRKLAEDAAKLSGSFKSDFEIFKKEKLESLIPKDVAENTKKAAEELGGEIGKAVSKGVSSEKVDASEFGSAESIRRLLAYRDFLNSSKGKTQSKKEEPKTETSNPNKDWKPTSWAQPEAAKTPAYTQATLDKAVDNSPAITTAYTASAKSAADVRSAYIAAREAANAANVTAASTDKTAEEARKTYIDARDANFAGSNAATVAALAAADAVDTAAANVAINAKYAAMNAGYNLAAADKADTAATKASGKAAYAYANNLGAAGEGKRLGIGKTAVFSPGLIQAQTKNPQDMAKIAEGIAKLVTIAEGEAKKETLTVETAGL